MTVNVKDESMYFSKIGDDRWQGQLCKNILDPYVWDLYFPRALLTDGPAFVMGLRVQELGQPVMLITLVNRAFTVIHKKSD